MQTDAEYAAYKTRASFFNATSRTTGGFVGLIFRRAPFVRLPDAKTGVGLALQRFENDVDLSGTTLGSYPTFDHYRLDADYKHGVHFTALPTAWVAGFEKRVLPGS